MASRRAVALRRMLIDLVEEASLDGLCEGPLTVRLPDGETESEATSFSVEYGDGAVIVVECDSLQGPRATTKTDGGGR